MNDGLKQRVVGAVVLLALAVIFLPMVFDFSGERHIDRTSRIPERPQIEPVEFAEPKRPENIQFPKPPDRAYQLDESRAEVEQQERSASGEQQPADKPKPAPKPKAEKPGLGEHGMLAGWVVQVGAFQDAGRADKLEQSLLKDGYKAYQQENRNRGLHFVYVGPDSDKQALLQSQKKIDRKYKLKSKILRFEP